MAKYTSVKNVLSVPIEEIRVSPVSLRDVDLESEGFISLKDSIATKGFNGAIVGRYIEDVESGKTLVEVVDGLQRFTAAKQCGLTEIPIDIKKLTDAEVLSTQIVQNACRVDTKHMEFAAGLKRMLADNPLMTLGNLASLVCKSEQWVNQRLSLNNLTNQKVVELINEGKITVSNAIALAKLPPEEIPNFIDTAISESFETFVPKVTSRVKEIKDARRKGQDAQPVEFKPVAFLRKAKDITKVLDADGKNVESLIKTSGVKTAKEGFLLGLSYCINLDPESVGKQQATYDSREAAKEERRADNKKKSLDKKKKKLAEEEAALAAVEVEETN